jgi:ribosomal protein S18 acetylase RimI-like enzyme
MFCDTGLAAKIERAERDLVAAIVARIGARVADVLALPISGGLASFAEPGSPMNKVVGLGFAPFHEPAWDAIERAYAERKAPIQVELSTLADPSIAAFLTRRGYALVGVENVLGHALVGHSPRPRAGIDVRESPQDELDAWIDVIVAGFAAPDAQGVASHEPFDRIAADRVIRDTAAADGFVRFTARLGGELAGGASMRITDGIAQLCGAATLPAHRRRGVQTTLLEHRLAFAQRRGCSIAVMTALPGSKSHENAHEQGFTLLYSRNVLVRDA